MHLTADQTATFLAGYADLTDDELFTYLEELTARAQAQEVTAAGPRGVFDALREDLVGAGDRQYLAVLASAVRDAPQAALEVWSADQVILAQTRAQMACRMRGVI